MMHNNITIQEQIGLINALTGLLSVLTTQMSLGLGTRELAMIVEDKLKEIVQK